MTPAQLRERVKDICADIDMCMAAALDAGHPKLATQLKHVANKVYDLQRSCAHGHTERTVGCVSCELLWRRDE